MSEEWCKHYVPNSFLFTSESVGKGHPDKFCDQLSDAILDACIEKKLSCHVACECGAKNNKVMVFGEIKPVPEDPKAFVSGIVKKVIKDVGYDFGEKGPELVVELGDQSSNITTAVEEEETDITKIGAGDQGLMYGYATDETKEMIPLSHLLAHQLLKKLDGLRCNGSLPWAKSDAKSQVTLEYIKDEEGGCVPKRAHTIVMSVQHDKAADLEQMRKDLFEHVIKAVFPPGLLDDNTKLHLQRSKEFVLGGPFADAGLTGRKIIVDTYGGWSSHGGGCFSGKDPTKVDRSGSYACRWIAKSLVSAGLARRVEVQVSYVIGHPEPLSISVNTFGTGKKTESELIEIIRKNFNLRPGMIIKDLDLRRPIYKRTAVYGHFGRSDEPGEEVKGFTWEEPKPLAL